MNDFGRFLLTVLLGTLLQLSSVSAQLPITAPNTQEPISIAVERARLTIRIYDYADLGASTRAKMAEEAFAILTHTHVPFVITDCKSGRDEDVCRSAERPDLLTVRVLRCAPNQVKRNALGLAVTSPSGTIGLVFHDRAARLSGRDFPLSRILGRAVAHEVVHMLVPAEPHTLSGLMKSGLSFEDLRPANNGWHWIPRGTIDSLQAEAIRRTTIPTEEARARMAFTDPPH